jgi:hypothetical protein
MCFQTPFYASTTERIIARVKAAHWSFKAACWSQVSDLAMDLVQKLLQVKTAVVTLGFRV